jgi:hypothetical protein
MNILESFLGSRRFATVERILEVVTSRPEYTATEAASKAKALLIFATSQQQTWLVANREKLYCVLEDLKDDPKIWWDLDINVSSDGQISLLTGASLPPQGQPVSIEFEDRSGESGALKIRRAGKQEPESEWLYSKKLFTTITIQESLGRLITEARS